MFQKAIIFPASAGVLNLVTSESITKQRWCLNPQSTGRTAAACVLSSAVKSDLNQAQLFLLGTELNLLISNTCHYWGCTYVSRISHVSSSGSVP